MPRLSPPRALILVLALTGPAAAQDCPRFFAGRRAPTLDKPALAAGTTPLYAAERLTAASVRAARTVDRVDAFHEESRLPEAVRSDLSDYAGSGWDRGHMAPSGDMPDPESQAESFTLANIVPQSPDLNRTLWAGIESAVRNLAVERGELYVVTGPLFEGDRIQALRDRVLIPTRVFKAVYDPARGEAGIYLARNAPDGGWEAASPARLAELGGLTVFPSLPAAARNRTMALPEPTRDGFTGRRREPSFSDWLTAELRRMARRAWRDFLRSLF